MDISKTEKLFKDGTFKLSELSGILQPHTECSVSIHFCPSKCLSLYLFLLFKFIFHVLFYHVYKSLHYLLHVLKTVLRSFLPEFCGNHPKKWLIVILTSWYSCLCSPFPHQIGLIHNPCDMMDMMVCDFQGWIKKGIAASCLYSWISFFEGS